MNFLGHLSIQFAYCDLLRVSFFDSIVVGGFIFLIFLTSLSHSETVCSFSLRNQRWLHVSEFMVMPECFRLWPGSLKVR